MIRRIHIEHYKSIGTFSHELDNLTLFVGPNATGKSNFVDAIRFVRDAVDHGLDRAVSDRHGIDSIRQWSPRKPYFVTLRLDVRARSGNGFLAFTLASKQGNHLVQKEEAEWKQVLPVPKSKSNTLSKRKYHYERDARGRVTMTEPGESTEAEAEQPEELFLAQPEARSFWRLARAIKDFRSYSIYPNNLRTPLKASSDPVLSSSGNNLTSIFRLLARSKKKSHVRARDEILECMKHVMPQLDSIRTQSVGGLLAPVFRVREADGRLHDFNVSQVSDGTLRILGLLTALYQPHRPDVIALEEPEQTVNPGVLALLADAMLEISSQAQVVVTTHSPELLDKLPDTNAVIAVEMEDGCTRLGPIDEHQRQAVKDRLFSLGELMSIEGLHR